LMFIHGNYRLRMIGDLVPSTLWWIGRGEGLEG